MFFYMHLYSKREGGLYILIMATAIHLFSEGKKKLYKMWRFICEFHKDRYSNFWLISCSLFFILELFPLDFICGQLISIRQRNWIIKIVSKRSFNFRLWRMDRKIKIVPIIYERSDNASVSTEMKWYDIPESSGKSFYQL